MSVKKLDKLTNYYFYHKPYHRSLDGLGVAFQVLMPEDSGSNPEAGSIYLFDEVCPGLGLLQPQPKLLPKTEPSNLFFYPDL